MQSMAQIQHLVRQVTLMVLGGKAVFHRTFHLNQLVMESCMENIVQLEKVLKEVGQ
jgi:hypothetical protein